MFKHIQFLQYICLFYLLGFVLHHLVLFYLTLSYLILSQLRGSTCTGRGREGAHSVSPGERRLDDLRARTPRPCLRQ